DDGPQVQVTGGQGRGRRDEVLLLVRLVPAAPGLLGWVAPGIVARCAGWRRGGTTRRVGRWGEATQGRVDVRSERVGPRWDGTPTGGRPGVRVVKTLERAVLLALLVAPLHLR